eukprot:1217397-Rhodomonas_salina.1
MDPYGIKTADSRSVLELSGSLIVSSGPVSWCVRSNNRRAGLGRAIQRANRVGNRVKHRPRGRVLSCVQAVACSLVWADASGNSVVSSGLLS